MGPEPVRVTLTNYREAILARLAAIPAHGWLVLYERCRNVSRGFIERTPLLILKRHAHEKGCPTWSDAASGRRFDAAPPKSSTLDGLDRRIAMVCGGAVDEEASRSRTGADFFKPYYSAWNRCSMESRA